MYFVSWKYYRVHISFELPSKHMNLTEQVAPGNTETLHRVGQRWVDSCECVNRRGNSCVTMHELLYYFPCRQLHVQFGTALDSSTAVVWLELLRKTASHLPAVAAEWVSYHLTPPPHPLLNVTVYVCPTTWPCAAIFRAPQAGGEYKVGGHTLSETIAHIHDRVSLGSLFCSFDMHV